MKKILLTLISVFTVLSIQAQFKSLASFKNDTTAFIVHNFMENGASYKGKTLKEVTKDLGLAIKHYYYSFDYSTGKLDGVYISIYPEAKSRYLIQKDLDNNAICITWENLVQEDLIKGLYRNWPAVYERIKDLKIKNVIVPIGRKSIYYDKYNKDTQTRSSEVPSFINLTPVENFVPLTDEMILDYAKKQKEQNSQKDK